MNRRQFIKRMTSAFGSLAILGYPVLHGKINEDDSILNPDEISGAAAAFMKQQHELFMAAVEKAKTNQPVARVLSLEENTHDLEGVELRYSADGGCLVRANDAPIETQWGIHGYDSDEITSAA